MFLFHGAKCILDDMIITGQNDAEHLQNLQSVLKVLRNRGLRLNKSKCEFLKKKVVFCGHEIDAQGLHKTQDKINGVRNAPQPTNVSQLRSFFGLVNYYHWFLPDLATVLHPLNQLLEKNRKLAWSADCQKAFEMAKSLFAVFLASHDYDIEYKSTTKHCNADGLSRLPVPEVGVEQTDPDDLLHNVAAQKNASYKRSSTQGTCSRHHTRKRL